MITPEGWARLAVGESDWYRTEPAFEIDFVRLRAHVAEAIRAAMNDALEEAAVKLEREVDNAYAAGLVRAMKVTP